MEAAGIPCAPIRSFAAAAASPQTTARDLVSTLAHPRLGAVPVVGQPVWFDGHKPVAAQTAPDLGADTNSILLALGLTAPQIDALRSAGVITEIAND